jgi:hypothetical protein
MDSKKLLKEEKLEQLLIANWSQFIDGSQLIAFVLKSVQDHKSNFAVIDCFEMKNNGIKATISRCECTNKGFLIWIEFVAAISNKQISEGTIECYVPYKDGIISLSNIIGNIYKKN